MAGKTRSVSCSRRQSAMGPTKFPLPLRVPLLVAYQGMLFIAFACCLAYLVPWRAGIPSFSASIGGRIGNTTTAPERNTKTMTATELFNLWTEAYQIEEHARRRLRITGPLVGPGLASTLSSSLPFAARFGAAAAVPPSLRAVKGPQASCPPVPAPHVECCQEQTALRRMAEQRGPKGEAPAWTVPQPGAKGAPPLGGGGGYPRPPWVRGAPEDNLPLTHQVQADIWQHQFPAHRCKGNGTRFLVTWWDNPEQHGIGSHLHLMTGMLFAAMESNRVLIVLNWTYTRAQHEGCVGPYYGTFECYFSAPASQECQEAGTAAYLRKHRGRRVKAPNWLALQKLPDVVGMMKESTEPLVVVSACLFNNETYAFMTPMRWGQPWLKTNASLALGTREPWDWKLVQRLRVSWWRAQGVRFLLRWPSEYLCHLLNFARHQTYGLEVADLVLREGREISQYGSSWAGLSGHLPGYSYPCHSNEGLCRGSGVRVLGEVPQSEEVMGSVALFPKVGKNPTIGLGSSFPEDWDSPLGPEPFLPRPIVRVHVRGSDKAREMNLFGFGAYQEAVERIRSHRLPDLRNMWLSSEEQDAFAQASKMKEWRLYSLEMEKKFTKRDPNQPLDQWKFATKFGLRDYVEASFSNLFIGQSSDAFVFTLQSNWDRLANELRVTSGKLNFPFVALNQGEHGCD